MSARNRRKPVVQLESLEKRDNPSSLTGTPWEGSGPGPVNGAAHISLHAIKYDPDTDTFLVGSLQRVETLQRVYVDLLTK